MPCHVKICGVTTVADASACVTLGASAIGLNFVAGSPRRVTTSTALAIAVAVRELRERKGRHVDIVGVVADMGGDAMRALRTEAALDCLQLHGSEPPEVVQALLPRAYKAVRVGEPGDVATARAFPGDYLLVDAKVGTALGGTGATFDWRLVQTLAQERKLTLAGGLRPENVVEAIRTVRPFCVDVASGVESGPGLKDLAKVEAFIQAARRA